MGNSSKNRGPRARAPEIVISPLFAPDLEPWEIVAKNKGPGARAPEIVIRTTVTTKLSISIKQDKLDFL